MMLRLLRISGDSLAPEYQDGDYVLVGSVRRRSIKPGDVIVFRHHLYGLMIKQVDRVAPEGDEFHVVGTQPGSLDSRRFGPISGDLIVGKVLWHIKKRR